MIMIIISIKFSVYTSTRLKIIVKKLLYRKCCFKININRAMYDTCFTFLIIVSNLTNYCDVFDRITEVVVMEFIHNNEFH